MTPDICQSNHGRADTSVTAYDSVRDSLPSARQEVFDAVRDTGMDGATCDEVEHDRGKSHQTCSARFSELKQAGLIVCNGRRRPTRSGCTARVYVASTPGRQLELELRV